MFSSTTRCGKLMPFDNRCERLPRMTTKFRTLCLAPARATPGMKLARAIHDREGSVLLAAGTTLDLPMLERLIRRGVETVAVLVPDARDEETIAGELVAARSRIDTIFRGPGSVAREALRDAILEFRIETTQ